ncbi:methyl-accepting chemotaxis protein [Ramlibacter humi]|uniref:HAMP domain-containing protein n=1 Tax=Ramlibacter humi TaxID=2530451 RepID=A0A4Z0C7X8_9BURK|nr:methyl-accepting chemotaxis protein [Ramlibacter humi]TFZ07713.1 HAMP domain-containing protein [Ramlibacter humi]
MKWNVGAKLATGFGLVLACVLAVGAACYGATADLIQANEQRRITAGILNRLDDIVPLVKEIELGTRSYYLTGDEQFLRPVGPATERAPRLLQEIRQLIGTGDSQLRRLDAIEPLVKNRIEHVRGTTEVYRSQGSKAVVQRILAGGGLGITNDITRVVREMQDEARADLQRQVGETEANSRNAVLTIVVGTGLAVLAALLAAALLTRTIARPLRQLTAHAARIERGDIRAEIPEDARADEVGALARAFSGMTRYLQDIAAQAERMASGDLRTSIAPQSADDMLGNAFQRMSGNLRDQIRGMVEAVSVLGASTTQIVASTSQLASSATESAAAVAQTTATVEEVRQTAELSNQKAQHVADSAQKAVQQTLDGRRSAEDLDAGMERVRRQMESIGTSMARLSQHGQTIGQIIATVEDLAVQSNLLAVNASIEAAKAGEQGKGFAVVAQEVRSLAAQSRQATAEVRAVLGDIQAATAAAVAVTDQGARAVQAGSEQTAVARVAVEGLSASIGEAAQAATQIAASSHQQLVGVDQVAGAMNSIKQASSQNMVSARQLESSAQGLNDLGHRLQQIVSAYRL